MPKITRKQQKIFASNATNNGVFGSLQANDPTHSQDPDAIQGRTAYANGWDDATYSAEKLPPLEEFQALQFLFSRQIAYIMQEGVPEWDTSTTYYKGALVKALQSDGSFILYASLVDNNQGNLVTDTTKWVITNTSTNFHQGIPNWRADVIYSSGDWVKAQDGGEWSIFESTQNNNLNNAVSNTSYWNKRPFTSSFPLLTYTWSDHILNDVSWLRADTFSWQSGDVYVSAYNHLVDDIDGITPTTETIGTYTITYYPCSDGHKVVLPDQADIVQNIYNESGVAWYYILDTTNTRFKLPRTKYGFTGLRDTVGKYVPESLPNIRGAAKTGILWNNALGTSGCFTTSISGGNKSYNDGSDKIVNLTMDASTVSSTYQNDAPVQQRATQMYLYFYIGNFTQSAVEQTAGLNTELFDDKMDLDLGNLTVLGKEYLSGIGMASSTYENLSLGSSGSTYTAPANGYYYLSKQATGSNQYMVFAIYNNGVIEKCVKSWSTGSNRQELFSFGVLKGEVVTVEYNVGSTVNAFRFFYAEGEV